MKVRAVPIKHFYDLRTLDEYLTEYPANTGRKHHVSRLYYEV